MKSLKEEPATLNPWAYFTDGGVDTNNNYYFLQNVWKKTNIWYCTVSHANVHVQSILKSAEVPTEENIPMNFLVKPKDKLKIRVPYEKYLTEDKDWMHLITNFQVHIRSGGYNAYVKSFAVFYSDEEIKNSKFNLLTKRFTRVKEFADISKLKLKVKNVENFEDSGIKIVEFDVTKIKNIERWFKVKSPGIYPLLWIYWKQKYVNKTVDYKITQNVAGRFISLKLIETTNQNATSNIDLYNLGLKGIPLDL